MVNFFIYSSLLLSLSYAIYKLFLQKETFFLVNRFVILSMVFLSVVLPLVEIPESWSFRSESQNLVELISLEGLSKTEEYPKEFYKTISGKSDTSETVAQEKIAINFSNIVFWVYLTGVLVFALTFIVQLAQLWKRTLKLEFIQDKKCRIYELLGSQPPFSFFTNIYINPSLYDYDTYQQILEHEKSHIKNGHFIDKLVAEFLVIFFWFNPFSWLLRKEISNNLEFQTDDEMLRNGIAQERYQMSLVKVSANRHPLSFVTNYNQSILEKRIRMMNIKRSSVESIWKYLMLFPIFGLTLLSFNSIHLESEGNAPAEEKYTYNYDHIEEILIEGSFASKSDNNTFVLANITGRILVEAHEKETIEISAIKTINAPTEEQIDKGVNEIKVGKLSSERTFAVFLESPYSKFDSQNNLFSHSENCDDNPCFDYKFRLDYKVKLPRRTNLIIQNVNGGDIRIENIAARRLNINHITGSIIMQGVTGTTQAKTISGNVEVTYSAIPAGDSSYKTISGYIEASYPADFRGEVFQKAGDGTFISDFEINPQYLKNNKPKSTFRIGPKVSSTFRFETTSGDIRLKSN